MKDSEYSALMREAIHLHECGKLDEAGFLYYKILKIWKGDHKCMVLYGILLGQNGAYKEALKLMNSVYSRGERSFFFLNNYGLALCYDGRASEAIGVFAEALRDKPGSLECYFNIGNAYIGLGKFEDAIRYFKIVISTDNGNFEAYNNMGNALLNIGRIQDALSCYESAININGKYVEALLNMGNLYFSLKKYEKSLQIYRLALSCSNSDERVHNNIGAVLAKLGKPLEAVAAFQRALSINQNNVGALVNLAAAFCKTGQYDSSISVSVKAAKLSPRRHDIFSTLGDSYKAKGDYKSALRNYQKAAKLGDKSAVHMINAVQGNSSSQPPYQYISDLFDDYSYNFDDHIINVLKYRIPSVVSDFLKTMYGIEGGKVFLNALDLGCGTGLSGLAIREMCKNLTGIDLSEKMLERARKKNIYDNLICSGISDFLNEEKNSYDLIMLCDVLIYFGDLKNVFNLMLSRSKKGSVLAFSTELCETGYRIHLSGRYQHSREYVQTTLIESGFDIIKYIEDDVRIEGEYVIRGGIYICEKI